MSENRPDRPDPSGPAGGVRQTPYELVFGAPVFEEEFFPSIQEEAEASGADIDAPDRFLDLVTVGRLIHQLVPPEPSEAADAGALAREMGHLLYQAYQFWRFDTSLLVLDEALARRFATAPPTVGRWELTPPVPAGYFQLPRNLFWARLSEDAAPEPVDGFFWSMVGKEDSKVPPYERLDVLLVLGMRPGRPGFGVIDVEATLPDLAAGHWADVHARPGGEDFANVLPGGELGELHALILPAEVLKLVSLCFWYIAMHPDAMREPEEATTAEATASPGAAPRTGLAARHVVEVGADG